MALPLLLLANGDEWFRDSIESVLVQRGFRVVTAENGPRTLEQARRHSPDGVILDIAFPPQWPDAFAVCRALREPPDPPLSPAAPIILTTPGPALRAQQLEALRHGAWELRGDPIDIEELSLRLAAYVQGKLEADRQRAVGLVDGTSGLYNEAGVARRAAELAALTARQKSALACVVFAPVAPVEAALADRLALAFKSAGRASDAVGRTGPAEFTVYAPGTDAAGAARLVTRVTHTVAQQLNGGTVALRAGYSAAPGDAPIPAGELYTRARLALDG